jgi:hypothetical protein
LGTNVIAFASKVVPVGAQNSTCAGPKDLPNDGNTKLLTLLVNVAMVLGPILDMASEVFRIVQVGECIGLHAFELVSDNVIQSRFITLSVYRRIVVGTGLSRGGRRRHM